jgi:hypothetical protein
MTDGFTALLRGGAWFDVSGEYGGVAVRVPLSEYHHQNQNSCGAMAVAPGRCCSLIPD